MRRFENYQAMSRATEENIQGRVAKAPAKMVLRENDSPNSVCGAASLMLK
jgi:hypothetical protein